jgi:host factor-I protein
MANKPINIQDNFLNQARKENIVVVIHLVNGFQLKGLVRGFDNFTVILESMGKQQMIYKHAISTITPTRAFSNSGKPAEAPKEEETATTEE